jgi:hypothetical protein
LGFGTKPSIFLRNIPKTLNLSRIGVLGTFNSLAESGGMYSQTDLAYYFEFFVEHQPYLVLYFEFLFEFGVILLFFYWTPVGLGVVL